MTSTTHTAITITTMDQQSDSNNTAPAMNSDEMLLESAAKPVPQVHHPLAGPASMNFAAIGNQQGDSNNTAPAMNTAKVLPEPLAPPIPQVHHLLAGPAYESPEEMLDDLNSWAKDHGLGFCKW